MAKRVQRQPLHPGEILRDQFLADFNVSINRLARDLRVPPTRIGEIVHGELGAEADVDSGAVSEVADVA